MIYQMHENLKGRDNQLKSSPPPKKILPFILRIFMFRIFILKRQKYIYRVYFENQKVGAATKS